MSGRVEPPRPAPSSGPPDRHEPPPLLSGHTRRPPALVGLGLECATGGKPLGGTGWSTTVAGVVSLTPPLPLVTPVIPPSVSVSLHVAHVRTTESPPTPAPPLTPAVKAVEDVPGGRPVYAVDTRETTARARVVGEGSLPLLPTPHPVVPTDRPGPDKGTPGRHCCLRGRRETKRDVRDRPLVGSHVGGDARVVDRGVMWMRVPPVV